MRALHGLSWGLFAFIGALGTLMSVWTFVAPEGLPDMFAMMGADATLLRSAEARDLVAFMSRWIATVLIGGNVLAVAIAVTALRRGERWAVLAMAYWPLMFLSHWLMYAPGPMRTLQLAWLLVSIPALIVLWRRGGAASVAQVRAVAHAPAG